MNGFDQEQLAVAMKKFQGEIMEVQRAIQALEVEGEAGGGAVRAVANGKQEIKRIEIDPHLVDLNNLANLETLVLQAVNQALAEAREATAMILDKATGGMAGNVANLLNNGGF